MLTVSLVGRTNVGKSTLFNRLSQKNKALVHNEPGVTRDWKETSAQLFDLSFHLIDTPGIETFTGKDLSANLFERFQASLPYVDIIIFMICAKEGLNTLDEEIAHYLYRHGHPFVCVANKCETKASHAILYDLYKISAIHHMTISAEHGKGMDDLYDFLNHQEKKLSHKNILTPPSSIDVRLSIIGRPNSGKSTLINTFLKEDRVLTGPLPGLTRDSIEVQWIYKNKNISLFDTAGIRKKSRIHNHLEQLSVKDTFNTIRFTHAVILLIDGTVGLDKQDLSLARLTLQEGRILILAINKWDVVLNKPSMLQNTQDRLKRSLAQLKHIPVFTISALMKQGHLELMDLTLQLQDVWNKRTNTTQLNQWLALMLEQHVPPLTSQKRRIKIRYATQIKTRPPTFVLFSNTAEEDFPESYKRYLINGLQEKLNYKGIPIRLYIRKQENPYITEKNERRKNS